MTEAPSITIEAALSAVELAAVNKRGHAEILRDLEERKKRPPGTAALAQRAADELFAAHALFTDLAALAGPTGRRAP